MRSVRFDLSVRTILLVGGAAASVWLLTKIWPIPLLLATSLMAATALAPVVGWLERHGVKRVLAVVLLVLTLFLIVALAALVVIPEIYSQARNAIDRLPEARAEVVSRLQDRGADRLAEGVARFDPTEYLGPIIINTGPQVLAAVATVVTMLVLTAYILLDARRLMKLLYIAVPDSWEPHLRVLLDGLQQAVGGYIRGQLTMSSIITIFVLVLFTALRLPNPAAFAILAAIADCIPVVGVFFVVVPLAFAAATAAIWKGALVAAAMVAYTQVENQVLVNYVFGKALDMPAAMVLVAVLCGGKLFGVAGALLSLPAAAAIKVVLEYIIELRDRQKAAKAGAATALAAGTSADGG